MKTKSTCKNRWWLKSISPKSFLLILLALLVFTTAQSAAQNYKILHTFAGTSNGYYPRGPLTATGATLYGSASGGSYDRGLIFKLNTNGTDYALIKEFTGSDGITPNGGLVLSDTTLFGTTIGGGISNQGTVFMMNTDGTGHTVLKHFTGSDGANPMSGLVLSAGTLYGTTWQGGVSNKGTVFKISSNGSDFAILKHFTGIDGAWPRAGLALSGGTLYGAIESSDNSLKSTVFKIDIDGSGFTLLKQLTGSSSGIQIYSPPAVSDAALYGTAFQPNPYSGLVFKLGVDGSDFAVLSLINGPSDAYGMTGPVLAGSTLFGTTGGVDPHSARPNNFGTVFRVNTDGTGYKVLQRFDFTNGSNPGFLCLSGTTLYGTAIYGGTSNVLDLGRGVVFSLSLAAPTIVPASQSAESGSTVNFTVTDPELSTPPYHWFFNGTNLNVSGHRLSLTNAQPDHSGAYSIVVTNDSWALTSAPALLEVIPPVTRRTVPGISLWGEIGTTLNVDSTEQLNPAMTWTPMATVSLESQPQYCFDISTPLPDQRFYRAWQSDATNVIPALGLRLIPALTVPGNLGAIVRVDGIDRLGPTNAWYPLATVTLTNTSQFYFDISAPGPYARLYRLVPMP